MKVINLLEFLNKAKFLRTLKYARCDNELVNFLDLMTEDEQFTQKIDLGILYLNQNSSDQYTVIDGINRLLSLSLLLHAICECYKKTTSRNDNAIKTIRKKYLYNGDKSKLILNKKDDIIYNKIINGERLSGHEKETPMFRLLHDFWSQIKEESLQASNIFTMLQKISVTIVDTENVSKRDLYYQLNKYKNIDQILLIEDFLIEQGFPDYIKNLNNIYHSNKDDILLFFKDFFVTKFNYKKFDTQRLYSTFLNYYITMIKYLSKEKLIQRLMTSAQRYYDIINVNFTSEKIRDAFIGVKKASGEDTYAYILEIYEDYLENNISEETVVEILHTITDYLKNRKISGNNVSFNELISYLNAFITCK